MITRYEETDARLLIESRYAAGKRAALRLLLAGLALACLMLATFIGMSLVTDGEIDISPESAGIIIAVGLAPLIFIPRFTNGSERLELRGTQFVHERFAGVRRKEHNEYDLLQMKGLRSTAGVGPQLETEWAGIGFWYRSGPSWFGDTFSAGERERVVASLLAFDDRVRRSLCLDPDAGLADVAYWDSLEAREAHLQELYSDQRFLG